MTPERLKKLLADRGLKQAEVGEACKIPPMRLSRYKRGEGPLSPAELKRLDSFAAQQASAEKGATRAAKRAKAIEDLKESLKPLDARALRAFDDLLRAKSKGIKLGALKLYLVYRHGRPLPLEKDKPKGPPAEDRALLTLLEQLSQAQQERARGVAEAPEPDEEDTRGGA